MKITSFFLLFFLLCGVKSIAQEPVDPNLKAEAYSKMLKAELMLSEEQQMQIQEATRVYFEMKSQFEVEIEIQLNESLKELTRIMKETLNEEQLEKYSEVTLEKRKELEKLEKVIETKGLDQPYPVLK